MKILELRFKNLNSLYGEWVVDFTHPKYVSDGIFALTGPTGAGKSTILDAICLALYGTTPRLGKITKSANEIMSRQTGECYAEVLFESQTGRFRCIWGQHRARKKPDGALQDAHHEIVDDSSRKPIQAKKKGDVLNVVEEKTGMDFERFTRSILLAQGGFDTFLKASEKDKSDILEQITGTGIYTQISQLVHERQRDEKEKLDRLRDGLSGITVLEAELENEIQKDLEEKREQEKALAQKSSETIKAITWLTTIEELKKQLLELDGAADKLQAEVEAFVPDSGRLERARKAMLMDGMYATLTAHRRQQSADRSGLREAEAALPEVEAAAKTQAGVLGKAQQFTRKAKEELKAATPSIQKIRSLDQTIRDQAKAVDDASAACAKDTATIKENTRIRSEMEKKRTEAGAALQTSEQYLKEHAQDEWLISGLAGIEEQLKNLLARLEEIGKKETAVKKAQLAAAKALKKFTDSAEQRTLSGQELTEAEKARQQGEVRLNELLGDKTLREYRSEKDALLRELALIRRIEELEEHRKKLEDGKQCPLCGSPDHPFAEGNIPLPDESERNIKSLDKLIVKAEEQEEVIKGLKEAEDGARKKLGNYEKLEASFANEKKNAERFLDELQEGLGILRGDFEELEFAVCQKLQPLGITEIAESQVSPLLESLKRRARAWQEAVGHKAEYEKQISDIDSELKRLTAIIEMYRNELAEKQNKWKQCKEEHEGNAATRIELYGGNNPDHEESRLNKAIADAESAENNAKSLSDELQRKLTGAKDGAESLKKRIEEREPALEKEEATLLLTLQKTGFADEKQFVEARLPNEERELLDKRAKELSDAQTQLKTKQHDRQARLADEHARMVTDKALEALAPLIKEYEDSLKAVRDAIAALNYKLVKNAEAKEKIREKQGAVDAQKKECGRWERLHSLIGSADGKKYRTFAQGLTFELMVSHANRQLEKMSDRYLLVRDADQPLELNVVDNYQAGEIRSTRNLSGGESFIVSLTLALGLSKMASRKVRVDSLFLDEGFGTLDEDALETALEALSGLHQDGKLIGVISHVSALKERISTQITISPVSGGRSSLSGPGCTIAEKKE